MRGSRNRLHQGQARALQKGVQLFKSQVIQSAEEFVALYDLSLEELHTLLEGACLPLMQSISNAAAAAAAALLLRCWIDTPNSELQCYYRLVDCYSLDFQCRDNVSELE